MNSHGILEWTNLGNRNVDMASGKLDHFADCYDIALLLHI